MTQATTRRLLWLAWCLSVPLPMLAIAEGSVPAVRFWLLGGVSALMQLAEGYDAVGATLAAVFLLQAALYTALLWVAARLAARLLSRLAPFSRTRATVALVSLSLALAVFTTPYRTPFGRVAHANLIDVLR